MHTLGKWGAGVAVEDVEAMRTAYRRKVRGDAPVSPECQLAQRKFLMSTSKYVLEHLSTVPTRTPGQAVHLKHPNTYTHTLWL